MWIHISFLQKLYIPMAFLRRLELKRGHSCFVFFSKKSLCSKFYSLPCFFYFTSVSNQHAALQQSLSVTRLLTLPSQRKNGIRSFELDCAFFFNAPLLERKSIPSERTQNTHNTQISRCCSLRHHRLQILLLRPYTPNPRL